MPALPPFQTLDEAFVYCRDMDASLGERLDAFATATRQLAPALQDAVDRLVLRLKQNDAGHAAPREGELMPSFALSDENGRLVDLEQLLRRGPVAVTFHRGHWCPYCRINTRALAEAQARILAEGGQLVAIMPERQQFASEFKRDSHAWFPILTDMDNGYALALNLAISVGSEMEQVMAGAGRDLSRYQGNDAWLLPIPATFVVAGDGTIAARFIDPDYRKRMAIEDLLAALRAARRHPLPRC